MYKCIDCQAEFEEPDMERERIGEYHGQPAYEYRAICPLCGSCDFEELKELRRK